MPASESPQRIVEIRCYSLKAGKQQEFHELVERYSIPMLKTWGTDVVGYGRSLDDEDGYFLARAYGSVEEMRTSQDAFYASDAWRQGPRESIVSLIESHSSSTLALSNATIEALREDLRQGMDRA
jgi:hypothetical protein